MYIQQYSNNNISMRGVQNRKPGLIKRLKQRAMNVLPNFTYNSSNLSKLSEKVETISANPVYNKLIMAGTGIVTQPVIDACNRKVDENTRKISVCRTVAKIVAGTLVGVIVRGGIFKLISSMSRFNGKTAFSRALLPKKLIENQVNSKKVLANYRNALSTILAIIVMGGVTNIFLDAPFTIFLTNKLAKRAGAMEEDLSVKDKKDEAKYV